MFVLFCFLINPKSNKRKCRIETDIYQFTAKVRKIVHSSEYCVQDYPGKELLDQVGADVVLILPPDALA